MKERKRSHNRRNSQEENHGMVKQIINLPLQSESKLTDHVDLAMRHKLSVPSQQEVRAETKYMYM